MENETWKRNIYCTGNLLLVNALPSLNTFKNRLDKHWINQDVLYVWHAEILGTGSRSNIFS